LRLTKHTRRPRRDNTEDRAAFVLAKVGLGMLGIVAEVTLQCVPAHKLVEHTVRVLHVTHV
jgi:hypothetical protein